MKIITGTNSIRACQTIEKYRTKGNVLSCSEKLLCLTEEVAADSLQAGNTYAVILPRRENAYVCGENLTLHYLDMVYCTIGSGATFYVRSNNDNVRIHKITEETIFVAL